MMSYGYSSCVTKGGNKLCDCSAFWDHRKAGLLSCFRMPMWASAAGSERRESLRRTHNIPTYPTIYGRMGVGFEEARELSRVYMFMAKSETNRPTGRIWFCCSPSWKMKFIRADGVESEWETERPKRSDCSLYMKQNRNSHRGGIISRGILIRFPSLFFHLNLFHIVVSLDWYIGFILFLSRM